MSSKDRVFQLCDRVRETSYAIHRYLGPGHLEKVYENALINRLRKQGLDVKAQHPLAVYDEDGTVLGEYFADLLVEDCLIVELKAARSVADEHVAQLLGYLRASRIEDGLLVNFGSSKFYIKNMSCPSRHRRQRVSVRGLGSSVFSLVSRLFVFLAAIDSDSVHSKRNTP